MIPWALWMEFKAKKILDCQKSIVSDSVNIEQTSCEILHLKYKWMRDAELALLDIYDTIN